MITQFPVPTENGGTERRCRRDSVKHSTAQLALESTRPQKLKQRRPSLDPVLSSPMRMTQTLSPSQQRHGQGNHAPERSTQIKKKERKKVCPDVERANMMCLDRTYELGELSCFSCKALRYDAAALGYLQDCIPLKLDNSSQIKTILMRQIKAQDAPGTFHS